MAAGFSINQADFATFQSAFEGVARAQLNEADLQAIIETDGSLDASDISLQTALDWLLAYGVKVFCNHFLMMLLT